MTEDMLARVKRIKDISDAVSKLSEEKNLLANELAFLGFEKDKVEIDGVTFTVSLEDHQQEGGSYGGFVYINRYGLRFYENKKKAE